MNIQNVVQYGAIGVVVVFGLFTFFFPRWFFKDNLSAGKDIVQGALKLFVYGIIMIFSILTFKVTLDAQYYVNGFVIVISGVEAICGLEALIAGYKRLKEKI